MATTMATTMAVDDDDNEVEQTDKLKVHETI